jgi:hypothetical protein
MKTPFAEVVLREVKIGKCLSTAFTFIGFVLYYFGNLLAYFVIL